MELLLTSGIEAELCREASQAAPDECCGLLLGRDGRVEQIKPATNVAIDTLRTFEIDPVALIAANRMERAGGPQVIGYYHSHPTGKTSPSATDHRMASGEGRVWAIVAGGKVGWWRDDLKGFTALSSRLDDG